MNIKDRLLYSWKPGLGLFILRVTLGCFMFFAHGLPKLINFSTLMPNFPDPLQIGRFFSLSLAVFAEFFCAIGLVLGLGTRLVLIPLIITMGVAAFWVHAADPFVKKEMALLFLTGFLTIFLAGPGLYSVDKK